MQTDQTTETRTGRNPKPCARPTKLVGIRIPADLMAAIKAAGLDPQEAIIAALRETI